VAADKAMITTVQQLGAAVQAIEAAQAGPFTVTSLQEHDAAARARREAKASA
jgi:carbamoyl-phosphate synthase large subunit